MSYEEGLFFRQLEKGHDAQNRPEALDQAFGLGKRAALKGWFPEDHLEPISPIG
jgi:hypothetical protein